MMIFALLLPAAFVCCEETKILEKGKTRSSLGFVTHPKSCASVKFSFHRVNIKKAAALLYPKKDDDDVFSSSLSSFAHAWCW